MNRHIGSAFAAESPLGPGSGRLGGRAQATLQSGGQALRAASRLAWQNGARRLAFPSYFCESMLRPFDEFGWDVSFYRLDRDLQPVWRELEEDFARSRDVLVLVAEYFGRRFSGEGLHLLTRVRDGGGRVVEDWTHSVLSEPRPAVDMAVASLRKTVPVGDGAWVWGFERDPRRPDDDGLGGPGEPMWAAMDLLASGNDDHIRQAARSGLAEAERRFANELEPREASQRTRTFLETLDANRLADARRRNANALSGRLERFELVNSELGEDVPSHLVLRVPSPRELQRVLASEGVYCPIHWVRPQDLSALADWDQLISIPIDHRYNEDDMNYVAEILNSARG